MPDLHDLSFFPSKQVNLKEELNFHYSKWNKIMHAAEWEMLN
jgi:hypothetical protein